MRQTSSTKLPGGRDDRSIRPRAVPPLLALAAVSLLTALWAGLFRGGWDLPVLGARHPMAHGPLFVSGFLGTVIALEKARAVDRWWGYAAPALAVAGALGLLLGAPPPAAQVVFTLASTALLGVFAHLWRRRPDLSASVMLAGAGAWLTGNALWLGGRSIPNVVFWWLAFPLLVIVGERLELSAVVPKPPWAKPALGAMLTIYASGLVWSAQHLDHALRIQGLGLLLVAVWLLRFDFARRALRSPGVHRYTATCLLSGFTWLAVAGALALFWGADLQNLRYDALLHTIFLGFVFGMIFGHAPIVAPMLLGRRLAFDRLAYAPLVLLQASLALRVAADLAGWLDGRSWATAGNAAAILLFLAVTVRAARRAGA